jgi:hypothetical protein
LVFGLFNSTQVIVFAVGRELVNRGAAGTALALTNMFVMLSGIFQPLSGWLLDQSSVGELVIGAAYSVHAYQVALSILPICLGLTVLCALFLKETYGQNIK